VRARGVGKIFVSEISASRQNFAKEFGADEVLDPRSVDVVEKVKGMTGEEGVDVVFDCAGVAKGLETACKVIRVKGTVVNVAIVRPLFLFPSSSFYSLL
jgi:threonine dehydrogenase-like Zn-dependent dehydrogenase